MKTDKVYTLDNLFEGIKSHSADEILAAGGAMAFGVRSGKNNQKLIEALEKLPPIEPFSDDEWNDLMDELARDK